MSLIRGSILGVTGYRNAPPPTPTPVRCCGACLQGFFSDKMPSLDIFDMYFIKFYDFSQHLALISPYLSKVNEIYLVGC